jgi:hypothetical protein
MWFFRRKREGWRARKPWVCKALLAHSPGRYCARRGSGALAICTNVVGTHGTVDHTMRPLTQSHTTQPSAQISRRSCAFAGNGPAARTYRRLVLEIATKRVLQEHSMWRRSSLHLHVRDGARLPEMEKLLGRSVRRISVHFDRHRRTTVLAAARAGGVRFVR